MTAQTSAAGSTNPDPKATALLGARLDDDVAIERSKFELAAAPQLLDAGELPWAYGEDRITALVRSPASLYVYWEITDEGIADARRRLGRSGAGAWCDLRVYDTTGRDFDGTNANDYFDRRIERGDRDHFFVLDRPGSSAHVEVGLMSHEGYFQPIVRSGRADFPRRSAALDGTLEWMTVTSGATHPAARPYESRYHGPSPGTAPGHVHGQASSVPGPGARAWESPPPVVTPGRWVAAASPDGWRADWRVHRLWPVLRHGWVTGPSDAAAWRVGPFLWEGIAPGRLEVSFAGGTPVWIEDAGSGVQIFGSWMITMKSFAGTPERRVLGAWRMHSLQVAPLRLERWWSELERRREGVFRSELVVGGASEARALEEAGASERWRMGASERWWLGASEWLALGASELAWLGASQAALGGASALLFGGASGWGLGGASERMWLGASPWALGGASPWALGGASPWALGGASEAWPVSSWSVAPSAAAAGEGWT